jgi:hypothetical protein
MERAGSLPDFGSRVLSASAVVANVALGAGSSMGAIVRDATTTPRRRSDQAHNPRLAALQQSQQDRISQYERRGRQTEREPRLPSGPGLGARAKYPQNQVEPRGVEPPTSRVRFLP